MFACFGRTVWDFADVRGNEPFESRGSQSRSWTSDTARSVIIIGGMECTEFPHLGVGVPKAQRAHPLDFRTAASQGLPAGLPESRTRARVACRWQVAVSQELLTWPCAHGPVERGGASVYVPTCVSPSVPVGVGPPLSSKGKETPCSVSRRT